MEELSKVFLPLRSNIGWYQSTNLQQEISNRVKESILLYDELYIEDGTLTYEVAESGNYTFYIPPGKISEEYRTIEYQRDLKPSEISLAIGPAGSKNPTNFLFKGQSIARYKIDYYNIFNDIDRSDYDFLKFVVIPDNSLPKNIKDGIEELNNIDESSFHDLYPNNSIRDIIVKGLNHDLVLSASLKSAIITDSIHNEILKRKFLHLEQPTKTKPVVEQIALRQILELNVPEFSKIPIEKVVELRYERSWCNFREYLRNIVATVKEDPEILTNPEKFEKIIRSEHSKNKSYVLMKKRKTGTKLFIELGMGILGTGILGMGALECAAIPIGLSIIDYWKDKNAWYAFLFKLERAQPNKI